jgi:hypothetical protein
MMLFARRTVLLIAFAAMSLGSAAAQEKSATVYKSPHCGCCAGYVNYLTDNCFQVQVVDMEDLAQIKRQYAVPAALEGCHTTVVDGYVIEGHVPLNVVDRLLSERPSIRGISLPGMPMGSPGMGGAKEEPFKILEISDGEAKVYAVD